MDPARREESLRDEKKRLKEERRDLRALYFNIESVPNDIQSLKVAIDGLDAEIAEIKRKIDIIVSQTADASVVRFSAEYNIKLYI